MCNLYSVTTNVEAIRAFIRDLVVDVGRIGNFEPQTFVVPDYHAPIVRNVSDNRELTKVRWGLAAVPVGANRNKRIRARG